MDSESYDNGVLLIPANKLNRPAAALDNLVQFAVLSGRPRPRAAYANRRALDPRNMV